MAGPGHDAATGDPPVTRRPAVVDHRHLRPQVERWLLRQGLPHFIEGYSATGDILTRAVPLLSVVLVAELALTFGDQARGWAQFGAFLGGLAVLLGAVVVVNLVRGRRPLQRPDRVGVLELAVFVVVPPVVVLEAGHSGARAMLVAVAQLVILAVVYLATSYGVVPMVRWAVRNLEHQVSDLGSLVGKALPLMLVFSTFLFLNAEVWQVANDMPPGFLAAIVALVVGVGSLSVVLSLRREVGAVERFGQWGEVYDACRRSPLAGIRLHAPADPAPARPLSVRARLNVELLLFVSRAIVVVLLTLCVFVFYVLFGLLTVRFSTIAQWVAATHEEIDADILWETTWFGPRIILTEQLLTVSTFIACFAGLQFTVSLLSDPTARAEFRADMATEIREALAVRAIYLDAVCAEPAA